MRARAAAAFLSLAVGEVSCGVQTPSSAAADAVAAPAREPARAEYAVRWDPSLGGPGGPDEVLAMLGAPRRSASVFEVQYFELPPPPDAPPDSTVILRRRKNEKGKTEIRLKYRRRAPLGSWACPAGIPFERQEEVDFSFTAAGAPIRVYSYSCTLSDGQPPAPLAAVPKKCASRMARYEADRFKVEEWMFPGGHVQLEVSLSARNTAEELAGFENVVTRLLERGVKPADRSKTEAGSECPEAGDPR